MLSRPERNISAGVAMAPPDTHEQLGAERESPLGVAVDRVQGHDTPVAHQEAGGDRARQDRQPRRIGLGQRGLRDVVLGADAARETVAREAVDALGLARPRVVDRHRDLKRVPAQLLGAPRRFGGRAPSGAAGERVRRRARGLDGIDAGGAVDLQQLLGGGVVALEIAVADRPAAKSVSRSRKAAPPKKIELPPTASLGKARAPAPSARWSMSIGLSPR